MIKRWLTDLLRIEKTYKTSHAWFNWLVFTLCVAWTGFQIWTFLRPMEAFYQRSLHMLFAYVLIFLTVPAWGKADHRIRPAGIVLAILSLVTILYADYHWEGTATSRGMGLAIPAIVMGLLFFVLTIEVCRRAVGYTMPILVVVLAAYARFGTDLPAIIAHPDFDFPRMVESFYISLEGVFGFLAYVSSTYIFVFVLFGSFLRVSGAGDFFTSLALSLFGGVRGGPAKIAVVASGLFGMVSGSAMANVAGVGQFTIPLMKRAGYSAVYAGAVETTASAGGQIMPPILGGAAFIMMEILGIPYTSVMKHVVIVAVLYYVAIFVMVDIQSQTQKIRRLSPEELPRLGAVLRDGWVFCFPPLFLMALLTFTGFSVTLCGFYATLSIVVVSWFKPQSRVGLKKILLACQDTCHTFAQIAAILAAAGLLLGLVDMTGLGLTLAGTLVDLANGQVLVLLALAAISALIMGMGMPTTAAYIILAVLVAPALIQLGVTPVVAHLFVFYYAIMSVITPPFAPDAFVAAAISGANPMSTAVQACKIGITGLILPFGMVYSDALIMEGPVFDIIGTILCIVVAIFALGAGVTGFLFKPLGTIKRLLCFIVAVFITVVPELHLKLVGIVVFLVICWIQNPRFLRELIDKYVLRRHATVPAAAVDLRTDRQTW